MPGERVLHDVAGAILDGAPVDWASAESSAHDESMQRIVRELKVIAAIADVHGGGALCADDQPIEAEGHIDRGRQENAADVDSQEKAPQTWGPLRMSQRGCVRRGVSSMGHASRS